MQTFDPENGDLQYYYKLGLKYSWFNLIREEKRSQLLNLIKHCASLQSLAHAAAFIFEGGNYSDPMHKGTLEADTMEDRYIGREKKGKEKHKAADYWKYSTYDIVSKYSVSVYILNTHKFCVP